MMGDIFGSIVAILLIVLSVYVVFFYEDDGSGFA
jgi:hypothetical protein